jgi:hypothetical protein
METKISLSIGILAQIVRVIKNLYFKICNYLFRPSIKIELKEFRVDVDLGDNKISHCGVMALFVYVKDELNIKSNNIKIGGENYTFLFQSFNPITNTSNYKNDSKTLNYYKDNWSSIHKGTEYIKVGNIEPFVLPLPIIGNSNYICNSKDNCMLFFPKKKLSIELNLNNKTFSYGLDLADVHRKFIKHIAFKASELKTLKEEYKKLVI